MLERHKLWCDQGGIYTSEPLVIVTASSTCLISRSRAEMIAVVVMINHNLRATEVTSVVEGYAINSACKLIVIRFIVSSVI